MEGYTEVFAWGGDHFGQLGLGGKVLNKTYPSPRFCSFNITIKEISCGEEHSGFISSSGHVYTMGSNTDGRLGINSRTIRQSASPCLVEDLISYNSVKISCGWAHTAIITDTGEVFTWGLGEFGALGNGLNETKYSPSRMSLPKSFAVDLSCGSRHTGIVVREKNNRKVLYMCGGGEAGQLGTGRREKELLPVMVDIGEEVDQVDCGVFHTGIVSGRGSVYMMGGNSFGQLGLGNKKSQNRPEKVVHLENVFIKKIKCSNFTTAVSDKGFLYVWGSGIFGEFLLPHRWSIREPILDIAIGAGFGIAIDVSGSVFVWGGNSNGELGVDDYEARTTPTLISSLKGKNIRKLSCGGNFCIGLGSDVQSRTKTPERKKRSEEDVLIRGRAEEMDKLNFEVKQTFRNYEEVKKNFESLSEKYEQEKRTNLKYNEELNREVLRFKQEVEKYRNQIEQDDREIRELVGCVNELKRNNHEICVEANAYKEELLLYKKQLDDSRMVNRNELKKMDEIRETEIFNIQEKYNQEIGRRKQMERELEKADLMLKNYENNMKSYQQDLNELSLQFEENSQQGELERKRLQSQVEKYSKDLGDCFKKNEILQVEKEKIQNLMKTELDRYFKENKELKIQNELLKDQIQEKNLENSELSKNLKSLNSEKQAVEHQFSEEIERLGQEKQKKLDMLFVENDKLRAENSNLIKSLDHVNKELGNFESLTIELERLENENFQLLGRIEYLIIDKEKMSAGLSTEIEILTTQKGELVEKYDQIYFDKEKKIQSLNNELEKNFGEYNQLKGRIEVVCLENEKLNAKVAGLIEENKDLRTKHDQIIMEYKRVSGTAQESVKMSVEIERLTEQKQGLIENYDQICREKEKKIFTLSSELEGVFVEFNQLKGRFEVVCAENEKMISRFTAVSDENKELRMQYDQLLIENKRYSNTVNESSRESSDLVYKLENLAKENNDLRRQVNCLDDKNRQLFENLEKELAQRAREYKERTMNILNMPLRSNSPSLRPPTPDSRLYNRIHTPMLSVDKSINEDYSGNTAARLLSTLEGSPRSRGNIRTPTKDDLKSKIANLMENRNRIETELRGLDEEE